MNSIRKQADNSFNVYHSLIFPCVPEVKMSQSNSNFEKSKNSRQKRSWDELQQSRSRKEKRNG